MTENCEIGFPWNSDIPDGAAASSVTGSAMSDIDDPRPLDVREMLARQWVKSVADGGPPAEQGLKALVESLGPRIKAFIRGHRLPDDVVDDLFQETFIKVYRAAGQYRGDSKVSVWICSIARNCVLDHLRGPASRAARHVSIDADADEDHHPIELPSPDTAASSDVEDCVRRALAAFEARYPDRARALKLSAMEGWSIDEMAKFLGRTLAATRQYLLECRKKMRPFLEPCRSP
jgi:RNA polymerase sigma-70 factor (ECF subfamily)